MSIKEKIQINLKEAMKAGEAERRDVLRMLDSAIKNVEIEKKKRESGLSEEEVVEVLSRAIKQRKDSAEQYRSGGRDDLAEKEEREMEILSVYMPDQLGEEEIRVIVRETIGNVGAKSKEDIGKVMGAVMGKVKGKADGDMVKAIVEKELS